MRASNGTACSASSVFSRRRATVWPGHDYGVRPSSTIALEKQTNPFFLCSDVEAFLRLKREGRRSEHTRAMKVCARSLARTGREQQKSLWKLSPGLTALLRQPVGAHCTRIGSSRAARNNLSPIVHAAIPNRPRQRSIALEFRLPMFL